MCAVVDPRAQGTTTRVGGGFAKDAKDTLVEMICGVQMEARWSCVVVLSWDSSLSQKRSDEREEVRKAETNQANKGQSWSEPHKYVPLKRLAQTHDYS